MTTASQIADRYPARDFDTCIRSTGPLDVPDALRLASLCPPAIDARGVFAGMNMDSRRTADMYLRILLPEVLASLCRCLTSVSDLWFAGETVVARPAQRNQSMLAIVLHRNCAELSSSRDWQSTWVSRLCETMAKVYAPHFFGSKKPGSHSDGELPHKFGHAFQRVIGTNFSGRKLLPANGTDPFANGGFLRKMLGRHFLPQRAMSSYLLRFPFDRAVHLKPVISR